jgi:CRISPR-associated protein Cst1
LKLVTVEQSLQNQEVLMLKYTGHPLVDVGVATIAAFAGKRDPTRLTEDDLDKMANYITREYTRPPLKSFFTVAFTVNAGFFQPGYNKQPEKRQIYMERVLRSYRADTPKLDQRCVFTGEPAVAVPFDVKGELPPGYTFRQHIPLLTGEGVINFYPYGIAGLPVSGKVMLALQAFPLGCAKCGGRLLAVHSDNDELTYHFAKTFLLGNRKAVQLAQAAGSKKLPATQFSHRTLLVDTLLQMQLEAQDESEQSFSLTAYHLSNSGQGPKLDIYHLPLEITGFLRDMQTADYHNEWNAIVRRAWEVAPKKKRGKKDDKPFQPHRNWLYEDLFDLPGNAPRFLRTYFLRLAVRYARGKTDPRVDYSLQNEANLISWKITEQFLGRITHMDKERVEQIRALGDNLADYVSSQNDRRFFRNFFTVQRYGDFRTALIKANLAHVKRGHSPIITLDPYIVVFEEGDELARPDWRLARDLVLIRMVERLYGQGWLGNNVDVIPEIAEEEEAESD